MAQSVPIEEAVVPGAVDKLKKTFLRFAEQGWLHFEKLQVN